MSGRLVPVSKQVSDVHMLGAVGGAGLALGGLARSRAGLGMVARGVRQGGGNTSSVYAAARAVRAATTPAAELMHSTKGVGGFVDLVPARFRPALAMGLGASILHHQASQIRRP